MQIVLSMVRTHTQANQCEFCSGITGSMVRKDTMDPPTRTLENSTGSSQSLLGNQEGSAPVCTGAGLGPHWAAAFLHSPIACPKLPIPWPQCHRSQAPLPG